MITRRIDELKANPELLHHVTASVSGRVQMCLDADGGHFENQKEAHHNQENKAIWRKVSFITKLHILSGFQNASGRQNRLKIERDIAFERGAS